MKEKKSVRTMDIILAVIAVFLLLFIVVMICAYFLHKFWRGGLNDETKGRTQEVS